MRLPVLALVIALLTAAAAADAVAGAVPAPVEVTQCGQRIPTRTTGFLSADLTCQGGRGVILEQKATLDLGGFTLSGAEPAVVCEGTCSQPSCTRMGRCEVRNGTIVAPFDSIIGDRVTVRDMTISGGNIGTPSIFLTSAARVDLFDSHLDAAGILARRVQVTGSTFVKSGVGGNRVLLTSTTVTGDGQVGVLARSVELIDSHVVGHGTDCTHPVYCGDLVTEHRPKLDATSTCDTSINFRKRPLESWGACALD